MKKIFIILLILPLFIIPLIAIFFNETNSIYNAIEKTNDYINEKMIDDNLFSNILQSKLDNSLTYNFDDGSTLIVYKNKYYSYKNNSLKK